MTETITCPGCGEWNLRTSQFCHGCGTAIHESAETREVPDAARPARTPADKSLIETMVLNRTSVEENSSTRPIDRHIVAFRTDIGYSHHTNQDAGGAWTWTRKDGTPVSFIAVADGVSAGRHSEEASKLTVDVLYDRLVPLLGDTSKGIDAVLSALTEAAKAANHEVAKRPHYSLSSADATTLVAAFCIGSEGGGVWCGDSRVYQVSSAGAVRLTRDHSWAEQVVKHGLMKEEDAASDPRAHMITRWLGPPPQEDPGIESFRFRLAPGQATVCCTDGLYMYFSPPRAVEEDLMARIIAEDLRRLQEGVDQVVDIALQRGGRDNITLAVIAADAIPEATSSSEEGSLEDTTILLDSPAV